jgi:hypothetical protein
MVLILFKRFSFSRLKLLNPLKIVKEIFEEECGCIIKMGLRK